MDVRLLGPVDVSDTNGASIERIERLSTELARRLGAELGAERMSSLAVVGQRLKPIVAVELADTAAAPRPSGLGGYQERDWQITKHVVDAHGLKPHY